MSYFFICYFLGKFKKKLVSLSILINNCFTNTRQFKKKNFLFSIKLSKREQTPTTLIMFI